MAYTDSFQGEDFSANITRARFEEINAVTFKSTLEPVDKVLKDAKMAREKACVYFTVIFWRIHYGVVG